MNAVEPQGIVPWVTQLWHEYHDDAPLVVIRCGADTTKGRCRGEVGRVWATPRGLLTEVRQSQPGREMPISPAAATKPENFSVMRTRTGVFAAIGNPVVVVTPAPPMYAAALELTSSTATVSVIYPS